MSAAEIGSSAAETGSIDVLFRGLMVFRERKDRVEVLFHHEAKGHYLQVIVIDGPPDIEYPLFFTINPKRDANMTLEAVDGPNQISFPHNDMMNLKAHHRRATLDEDVFRPRLIIKTGELCAEDMRTVEICHPEMEANKHKQHKRTGTTHQAMTERVAFAVRLRIHFDSGYIRLGRRQGPPLEFHRSCPPTTYRLIVSNLPDLVSACEDADEGSNECKSHFRQYYKGVKNVRKNERIDLRMLEPPRDPCDQIDLLDLSKKQSALILYSRPCLPIAFED